MTERSGPLVGLKVLEFARGEPERRLGGLLSQLGAEVLAVQARGEAAVAGGRRSVALDLKRPAAAEACLRLVERADVLVDGEAPGALERLGLGPLIALARNPALVYAAGRGGGEDAYALAFAVAAAIFRARDTGQGQVVEAAARPDGPPELRFSVTPGAVQADAPAPAAGAREALSDWGLEAAEIDSFAAQGVL